MENLDVPKAIVTYCNDMSDEKLKLFYEAAIKSANSDESVSFDCFNDSVPNHELLLDLIGTFLQLIHSFNHNADHDFYKALFSAGFTDNFIQRSMSEIPQIHFAPKILRINKLIDLKWRLDISFCDSKSLQRIPVPVIIHFSKNDKKYTIEMNVSSFHKLRFAVALLVKKMLLAKNMNCLKS